MGKYGRTGIIEIAIIVIFIAALIFAITTLLIPSVYINANRCEAKGKLVGYPSKLINSECHFDIGDENWVDEGFLMDYLRIKDGD